MNMADDQRIQDEGQKLLRMRATSPTLPKLSLKLPSSLLIRHHHVLTALVNSTSCANVTTHYYFTGLLLGPTSWSPTPSSMCIYPAVA